MEKQKVTFSDIAKYTNFSKTTISRYFNHPESLTPENQEIIRKALVELNYHENKIARVLANGRTEFVGIIIPTLFFHYFSETLNQLLTSYEKYGYKFLVFVGTDDKQEERKYIRELLAYNIEGMIIMSHTIPSKELATYNIPVVAIEREDKYVCSVNTDNYMGGVQATSLLAKNNCDVLIHVNTFVSRQVPAFGRIRGFVDLCEEQHIPHEVIQRKFKDSYELSNATMHEIYEYIRDKYPGKKKGIFLSNDTYANLLLNVLIREHHKLPDEYRLVGFDNSPIAQEAVVPISTVGQQIEKIADVTMELLIDQIEQRKNGAATKPPIHKTVTPILIRRETTD